MSSYCHGKQHFTSEHLKRHLEDSGSWLAFHHGTELHLTLSVSRFSWVSARRPDSTFDTHLFRLACLTRMIIYVGFVVPLDIRVFALVELNNIGRGWSQYTTLELQIKWQTPRVSTPQYTSSKRHLQNAVATVDCTKIDTGFNLPLRWTPMARESVAFTATPHLATMPISRQSQTHTPLQEPPTQNAVHSVV